MTAAEVVAGLAGAVIVGAADRRSRCTCCDPVRRALYPLVVGSQAVPIPAIAPLLIFLLGFGLAPEASSSSR